MARFSFTPSGKWPNSSKLVQRAITLAEAILDDPNFYAAITAQGQFEMADVGADVIAKLIEGHATVAPVSLYRKLVSKAYARTIGGVFELNVRHLVSTKGTPKRTVESIVGTLVHEYVHVVDNANEADFGHGDNSPVGKEDTAPYWIGELAVRFASVLEGTLPERRVLESLLASASVEENDDQA